MVWIFSKLANARQPPADVSKARIQVNKIALISLANETVCPLQDLVVHAQNAGYSVVVIFFDGGYPDCFHHETKLQDKLLIPVLYVDNCYSDDYSLVIINDSDLLAADRTNIEITRLRTDVLKMMGIYLRRLYYWFLLGPVITIEWLRRGKKLSCMSGSRGRPETPVESGPNIVADHEVTRGETMPLLPYTDVPRNGHSRLIAVRRILSYLREGKLAVGCGYVILTVVALPVGISGGGWSFFRFDENEIQQSFWDDLIIPRYSYNGDISYETYNSTWTFVFFDTFLPLLWSPLQIFCFFLYSRFACKTTWTVPTNYSKLIRSDWFASNMYLLILGIVVPFCSSAGFSLLSLYLTSYNTMYTICNLLFIIILNKHMFVTRYVFYISVCMVCAYIESNIVAVVYFMMNSQGSLANLKLNALRTLAIGLTLTLSFNSSMHIIRKLAKPRESLFEGLAEK